MDTLQTRWEACRTELQKQLGNQDVDAWLNSLRLRDITLGQAVLSGVPNTFFKARISSRFTPLLRDVIAEHFPETGPAHKIRVALVVGDPKILPPAFLKDTPTQEEVSTPPSGHRPFATPDARHTFATFIEGPDNRTALAAAQQVAAKPAQVFNPLILIGGVGLGKSHLLNAIAVEIRTLQPSWNTELITAEGFANIVLDGIREKRMKTVRERFRNVDALLIDDLEFLLVSGRTQDELLHTFDALLKAGKQLVFCADRFPSAMQSMNPTLRTRLETGLSVEIQPPGRATRRAILSARLSTNSAEVPEPVLDLLAEKISSGPRQLEGALLRLLAYASMEGKTIDLAFARRVALPFFDDEQNANSMTLTSKEVLATICREFSVQEKTLRSASRVANIVRIRKLVIYFLRRKCELSFPEIGALLGHRAHSTIIHAMRSADQEAQKGGVFQEMVRRMEKLLSAGST